MGSRKSRIMDLIMNPESIHLFTSIVEAYEGMGTVSTVDRKLALVRLLVAPGWESEAEQVVMGEAKRLGIRSHRASWKACPTRRGGRNRSLDPDADL